MFDRLKRWLAPEQRAAPGSWADALTWGLPNAAGVAVTPETALQVPAVFGCVRIRAETLAQLCCNVTRPKAGGGREIAADHPVQRLVADAPNSWMTAAEFRQSMESQVSLHGNAYAYVVRDSADVPVELIVMERGEAQVIRDPATLEPQYSIAPGGAYQAVTRRDLIHVRNFGTWSYVGESPIAKAADAIGVALLLQRYQGSNWKNGARPSATVTVPKGIDKDAFKRMKKQFDDLHSGADKGGQTLFLDADSDFKPIQINATDQQLVEQLQDALLQIARIWRIPPSMLGDMSRATFNNSAQQTRSFLDMTVLPMVAVHEGALSLSLLAPEERAAGYRIEFDLDDLLKADMTERYAAYATAVAHGLVSANEVRTWESLPAYEGGNEFYKPVNTMPVSGGNAPTAAPANAGGAADAAA